MNETSIMDGWMRFWGVFSQPLPVVVGFALAHTACRALYEIAKHIAMELWKR